MENPTRDFQNALKCKRLSNGSVFMYAELNGFSYGQHYPAMEKDTIKRFVDTYLPFYIGDIQDALRENLPYTYPNNDPCCPDHKPENK